MADASTTTAPTGTFGGRDEPDRRPAHRRARPDRARRRRPQALRGAAAPPRLPRRADRARQPRAVLRPHRACAQPRRARRRRRAVLFVDLDDFKPVNDRLGHAAGDRCCSSWPSARGVRALADTVARLGGDEFGILLEGATASVRSRRPSACWRRSRRASTFRARRCGSRPASASRSAATACATSRNCCAPRTARCTRPSAAASTGSRVHDPAAPVVAADGSLRLFMSSEAQRAEIVSVLEDPDALTMVFQPVLDLRTGRVAAYEALARFNRTPVRSPDKWFAQAHRFGLGAALEARALAAALAVAGPPAGHAADAQPEPVLARHARDRGRAARAPRGLRDRGHRERARRRRPRHRGGDRRAAGPRRGAGRRRHRRGLRRPHARDAARPRRDQARPRAHHRHRLRPGEGRAGQLLRALRARHRRHRLRRGHRDRGRAGAARRARRRLRAGLPHRPAVGAVGRRPPRARRRLAGVVPRRVRRRPHRARTSRS